MRGACLARSMGRRGRAKRLVLPAGQRRTTCSIGLMDEDGMFIPVIPLDCTIPDEGLERDRPNTWSGDGPIVLWENLGFEKQRVRPDGSRNPLLQKLGTWQPVVNPKLPPDANFALRLKLNADFTLAAALVGPDNQIVPLRQRAVQ